MFYVTITRNFECFQFFNFERNLKKTFKQKPLNISIPTKPPSQKPMLRQIEWGIQNGSITKNTSFASNYVIFGKFCFSKRTCYKELI